MNELKLAVALVAVLAGATARADAPKVVIATGGIGGVYYYYGTQIAEIMTRSGVASATAIQTAASVDNMLLVRDKTRKDHDTWYFAAVLPDTAYVAVKGLHPKFKEKPVDARILWMMYPNYLHLVTTAQSGIAKLADLKGKRVSTGAPGSGTEFTALNLLEGAGVAPASFTKWEKLGAEESGQALGNGTVDAYFWSGGLPTGSIVELANTLKRKGTEIRLVALPASEPGVVQLKKKFAGLVDSLDVPKAVYGTPADVPTVAFWNMFLAPASTPDDLAYRTTKAVFEHLDGLRTAVKAAKDTTPENSAKFIGNAAIPFHPGAVRYFKEKGFAK